MKYEISFKADLTPEKLELLELHLEDTLKLMGLDPEDLSITLREKPDPIPAISCVAYEPSLEELLTVPLRHTEDLKKCFEACKSKADVKKVISLAPSYLGPFEVDFDDDYRSFSVYNYYEDDDGDYEEEYMYDYPVDWEDS